MIILATSGGYYTHCALHHDGGDTTYLFLLSPVGLVITWRVAWRTCDDDCGGGGRTSTVVAVKDSGGKRRGAKGSAGAKSFG